MIVQRGYYPATSLHSLRLRQAPLGHFFNVITNGYGAMPSYAAQLSPANRWAVVAYLRALQLSQNAAAGDIPEGAHPVGIRQIAQQQGLEESFADISFWHDAVRTPSAPALSASKSIPAVGSSAVTAPETTASPSTAATNTVSETKPEVSQHTGDVVVGRQVYEDNCSICHQPNLVGRPPNFPALVGVVARIGEDDVVQVVLNGVPDARPMMPAFDGRLSSTEIANLIAYLKSVKQEN